MELNANFRSTELGKLPEEWSVRSLRELGKVHDGTHQTPRYVRDGVPFYSVEHVTSGDFSNTKFISPEEHRFLTRTFKMERGDVLMTRIGSIGECRLIDWDVDASFYVSLALLKLRDIDTRYFAQYSNSPMFKQEVELHSLPSAVPRKINLGPISYIRVAVPPMEEQRAIATALSDVDALIAGLERLIAKKRDIKQAAMQQLLTGQTRLPGFSGEWSRRRLGELADMGSGGTPPAGNPGYYGGSIPWVAISDMTQAGRLIEYTERSLSDSGLSNSAAQLFPAGTVLYAMYASLGECSIACMELCTSQAILGIRPRAGLVRDFLYYSLISRREFVKTLGQQGTQSNLNKSIVQSFEIHLPAPDEQTAIATVFSDMDVDLSALESRLAKTRAIKQGMMQELLTGRTRLV